jgi:hypothetical protein
MCNKMKLKSTTHRPTGFYLTMDVQSVYSNFDQEEQWNICLTPFLGIQSIFYFKEISLY